MLNIGKNLQEFSWVLAGISCCTSKSFKLESLSCCVCPQSKCSRRSDVCGETLSCGFVFRRKLCESAFGYCKSPMPKSFRALLRFSQIFWFWHCSPCCYFLSCVTSTNSFCKKNPQQCQQKPPNEQKNKQTPKNNNTNPITKNDEQKWNKKNPKQQTRQPYSLIKPGYKIHHIQWWGLCRNVILYMQEICFKIPAISLAPSRSSSDLSYLH